MSGSSFDLAIALWSTIPSTVTGPIVLQQKQIPAYSRITSADVTVIEDWNIIYLNMCRSNICFLVPFTFDSDGPNYLNVQMTRLLVIKKLPIWGYDTMRSVFRNRGSSVFIVINYQNAAFTSGSSLFTRFNPT
jgi:hypothetical protein